MNSNEIRQAYLEYFREKQHIIIPGSSLIPHDDPTLLLTTAGMVQIKPYFLGKLVPPNPRLASCQKCFRTTDIDSVGDVKHLTFFEMLGNFSVGNYFKYEAIHWAWEFVVDYLKINPDNLSITVFQEDDEAFNIWKEMGIPENKIYRCGAKDNFWGPAGNSGPCGPCSEIHYDFGNEIGCGKPDCNPSCGCDRFLEIWNLVFTQYNQDPDGNRVPLPKPNIDTGMGLERITSVIQGVKSVYESDLFVPIIAKVSELSGKEFGQHEEIDRAIRIIAEHSRGIAFLIADGILPSNEGRGYVLRRILRRASFLGRKIGMISPFLYEMTEAVVNKMKDVYPELVANQIFIKDLVKTEEEKFSSTLDSGISMVEKLIADTINQGKGTISGNDVFRLYDTFGFMPELTAEIAVKNNLTIDSAGFEKEMDSQRRKARASQKFAYNDKLDDNQKTNISFYNSVFIGYDNLTSISKVKQIIDSKAEKEIDFASEGQTVNIILDRNPFYGEMGGQIGDQGEIKSENSEVEIIDAISYNKNIRLVGRIKKGKISIGDEVKANVDPQRRYDIARNHTATHLLQAALRNVLGSHVSQRGSLVAPERLRFDFSHLKDINNVELRLIQDIVNEKIRQNLIVRSVEMSYNEAIISGAMALFEDKYSEIVRVLIIGEPPFSIELCGGTHVNATGEIGIFYIVSEGSIGTGLRRIEAVAGREAEILINERIHNLDEISKMLNTSTSEAPLKVDNLLEELKAQTKLLATYEHNQIKGLVADIFERRETINNINVISQIIPNTSISNLRKTGDLLKEKLSRGIIVLGSVYEGKPVIIAMVTPDIVKKGVNAGELIKQVAKIIGGSGGGRAELAEAGGKNVNQLDQAIDLAKDIIKRIVG